MGRVSSPDLGPGLLMRPTVECSAKTIALGNSATVPTKSISVTRGAAGAREVHAVVGS